MNKLIVAAAAALILTSGAAFADQQDHGDSNFGRQDFIEKRWPTPKGKRVLHRWEGDACDVNKDWRVCAFRSDDNGDGSVGPGGSNDSVGRE